jgi:hypothetical protein
MKLHALLCLAALLLLTVGCRAQTVASDPPQIPLCMIGDSITWAGDGDYWRQDLLELLPNLAFVGTHTAVLGYSHAGEGGNGTGQVLARLKDIPDYPYYHLLIGTNNTGVRDASLSEKAADATADSIIKIVQGLLEKPSVRKVFLASILPCFTDNPLRDSTNSRCNALLKEKLAANPLGPKVVWIEYEAPIRAIPNWEPLIKLHPTKEGYRIIAKMTAEAISKELGITEKPAVPKARPGAGVRVVNLWDAANNQSLAPLIPGWYTVSGTVTDVDAAGGTARFYTEVADPKSCVNQTTPVATDAKGKRVTFNFFTGYAGYGYTIAILKSQFTGFKVENVLLEKRRPSGLASVYGVGSYLDTTSPPALGELLELP